MELSSWTMLGGWLVVVGIAFSSLGRRHMPANIILVANYDDNTEELLELMALAQQIISDAKSEQHNHSEITVTTKVTITHHTAHTDREGAQAQSLQNRSR